MPLTQGRWFPCTVSCSQLATLYLLGLDSVHTLSEERRRSRGASRLRFKLHQLFFYSQVGLMFCGMLGRLTDTIFAGSPWLPFSPRWLLQQDRVDEALSTIRRLHRSKDDPNDARSNREFFQMKRQLDLDRRLLQNASKWQIFATLANRKRAVLGFILMFGNQFTVSTPFFFRIHQYRSD
jgi:hypothetical protein